MGSWKKGKGMEGEGKRKGRQGGKGEGREGEGKMEE